MASFGSLSPQDQKTVVDFSTTMRGYVGEMARTLDKLRALNDYYLGVAGPVLNQLTPPDNGIAIPDNTGLAGAVPLTPFEMGLMMNHMQALLATNTDANIQVWAKACGPGDLTG